MTGGPHTRHPFGIFGPNPVCSAHGFAPSLLSQAAHRVVAFVPVYNAPGIPSAVDEVPPGSFARSIRSKAVEGHQGWSISKVINGRPLNPGRFCRNRMGVPRKIHTSRLMMTSRGKVMTSPRIVSSRSRSLFETDIHSFYQKIVVYFKQRPL
jgi:hypothetical protein